MRCIFCDHERPSSLEHVFPDAIGGTLKIDRVCKSCNEKLGKEVDVPLVDHLHCKIKRLQYNIKNRHGWVPSHHDILGVGALQDGSGSRVKIQGLDPDSGKLDLRLITAQRPIEGENGEELINIRVDVKSSEDLPKIVNRRRRQLGLPILTEDQMAFAIRSIQRQRIEDPEVVHNVMIDLESYRRGLAKIAYEAAHLWLGDTFLEDYTGRLLRSFILGESGESIKGTISWDANLSLGQIWTYEPDSHMTFITRLGASLVVVVRVFGALYAIIAVTENPEHYSISSDENFYSWNPVTKETRRGPLHEDILRLIRAQADALPNIVVPTST